MTAIGKIAKDQILSIVERIERHEEEKRASSAEIKDIYAEAKATGFDTKALRHIVRLRRQKDYEEELALLEVYKTALGMK